MKSERFGGSEKLLSIGTYPETSLAEARQRRDQASALLANGIDPSETKKAQKAAGNQDTETFEIIAREWYAKFSPSWATSHAKTTIRRLELFIFPWLGVRPVKTITAPELLAALRGCAAALKEAGKDFALSNPYAERPNLYELHMQTALAAIAKAEGATA